MNDLKEVLRAIREERYATAEVMLSKILDREWGQVDDAKEALQVALSTEGNTNSNLVKTYCGGKPNYCVDAVNMSQECVYETAKGGHKWVGLTKEEFEESVDGLEDLEDCWVQIETKLRDKNT